MTCPSPQLVTTRLAPSSVTFPVPWVAPKPVPWIVRLELPKLSPRGSETPVIWGVVAPGLQSMAWLLR